MAMLRSALGMASHRLSGSSASQRGAEILRSPTLPSPPEPATQLMRTFMSADRAAAAARTRGVPIFQGWQHFPVETEGMKCLQQKRFLSGGRKELSDTGIVAWLDRHFGPRRQLILATVVGVSSFVATTIAYRRLDKAPKASNNFNSHNAQNNRGEFLLQSPNPSRSRCG